MSPEVSLPSITIGTGLQAPDAVYRLVREALDLGFRSFDTASMYGTESAIGRAFSESGVERAELFVTVKVRGHDIISEASTRRAVERSVSRLGIDHADLLLPHWPLPMREEVHVSYLRLVALRDRGLTRSVGLSNASAEIVRAVRVRAGEWPLVNQVHLSPYVGQADLVRVLGATPVAIQAYRIYESGAAIARSHVVSVVARRHRCTAAAVLLHWQLVQGRQVVTGARSSEQLRAVRAASNVALSSTDLDELRSLDRFGALKPDPARYFEL